MTGAGRRFVCGGGAAVSCGMDAKSETLSDLDARSSASFGAPKGASGLQRKQELFLASRVALLPSLSARNNRPQPTPVCRYDPKTARQSRAGCLCLSCAQRKTTWRPSQRTLAQDARREDVGGAQGFSRRRQARGAGLCRKIRSRGSACHHLFERHDGARGIRARRGHQRRLVHGVEHAAQALSGQPPRCVRTPRNAAASSGRPMCCPMRSPAHQ